MRRSGWPPSQYATPGRIVTPHVLRYPALTDAKMSPPRDGRAKPPAGAELDPQNRSPSSTRRRWS